MENNFQTYWTTFCHIEILIWKLNADDLWNFKGKLNQENVCALTKYAFFCFCYSSVCYTVLHMCGHTILHNYSVIIFCDGETSEIFLTTRALIYADLMGDYCDFWKVFTWRSGAQCDWTTSWLTLWTVFFRFDIKWTFCEFLETFHNIACWEYGGRVLSSTISQLFNPTYSN